MRRVGGGAPELHADESYKRLRTLTFQSLSITLSVRYHCMQNHAMFSLKAIDPGSGRNNAGDMAWYRRILWCFISETWHQRQDHYAFNYILSAGVYWCPVEHAYKALHDKELICSALYAKYPYFCSD